MVIKAGIPVTTYTDVGCLAGPIYVPGNLRLSMSMRIREVYIHFVCVNDAETLIGAAPPVDHPPAARRQCQIRSPGVLSSVAACDSKFCFGGVVRYSVRWWTLSSLLCVVSRFASATVNAAGRSGAWLAVSQETG
jgi:hypothetical protein